MHYGFRIVEHMIDGLEMWMRRKGFAHCSDFIGRSVPCLHDWADLNLSYKVVAHIDQDKCVNCGLCYVSCEDGCHQSIKRSKVPQGKFLAGLSQGSRQPIRSGDQVVLPSAGDGYVNVFEIVEDTCVGCNMCSLVCPVQDCITMQQRDQDKPPMTWRQYQDLLARGKIDPIKPPEHV